MILKKSPAPPLLLINLCGIGLLFLATLATALFDASKSREINTLRAQLAGQLALNQALRDRLATTHSTDKTSVQLTITASREDDIDLPPPNVIGQSVNRLIARQDQLWEHLEILHSALANALTSSISNPTSATPSTAPLTPYNSRYATDRIIDHATARTPDTGVAPPLPDRDLQPLLTPIGWRR